MKVESAERVDYAACMTTAELVAQRVRTLPEPQASAVLAFIEELSTTPVLGPAELMRLPPADRRRILSNQARQAEILYRRHPDMIVEETDPPLDHG